MKWLLALAVVPISAVALAGEPSGMNLPPLENLDRTAPVGPRDPVNAHHKQVLSRGGSNESQVDRVMSRLVADQSGMNQIQGKCETKTKDPIPVVIPCRNVELILKSGTKTIEQSELDPRGGFLFDKLSTNLIYTLLVRPKSSTHTVQMDELRTGMIYSFTLD